MVCFNFDVRLASELMIEAVGQENWEVEFTGKASHVGMAPDKGISATMVRVIGLAEAKTAGWFGKIVKAHVHGTSNVGIFGGRNGAGSDDATNVVTYYAWLKGGVRSPDEALSASITAGLRDAFNAARGQVTYSDGEAAVVELMSVKSYPPFNQGTDLLLSLSSFRSQFCLGFGPLLTG